MMGAGHASSGLCAGLATGDALMLSPLVTVALGLAGAGSTVISDIDCKGSTAATAFGPFSQLAHFGAVELHNVISEAISTDHEEHSPHRGLTHWWPFWVASGAGVWALSTINQWVVIGMLAVLFALAARGLTIPDLPMELQSRFADSLRHQMMMRLARKVLYLCPLTWFMIRARKHVAKTRRYGWWIFTMKFGVGKVTTALASLGLSWFLVTNGAALQLGPWLGLIVGAGMALHYVGDCPTHMGVPGVRLHKFWKLPFWASFYAGGPFELIVMWFSLGWLNILLIPRLLSHDWQMFILFWVGLGLGAIILILVIIEGTNHAKQRRYVS